VFYRDYAVADTVNGRLDLIVLYLALVPDRLAQDPALQSLGQRIFDRFCQNMDHNLREMGIGDLKVPKQMRRVGEAYYGRSGGMDGQGRLRAGADIGTEYLWRIASGLGFGTPPCGLCARGVT
jgi:hypothetical protein